MLWLLFKLFFIMFALLLYCAPAVGTEGDASPARDNSGKGVWSISSQTGYQHMDLHFKAPFVRSNVVGFELFTRSPLNLRLRDGNFWVSGIEAGVKKGGFSAFLQWKINKPRETEVISHAEPFWGGLDHVKWHDCNLKWWAVDAGAGLDVIDHFTLIDHVAIQAGLRVEHLYLGLHRPVDHQGIIPQFQRVFGDDYRGHLDSELVIPWIGVRLQASRFDGSLRFSPYAYADLKIPFTYYFVATPLIAFEQQTYSFKENGVWLEGSLAYDFYKTARWSCSLWGQASWLWVEGRAHSKYQADAYLAGSHIMTMTDIGSKNDSGYNTGTYGIGVRVNYYF